MHQCLGIRYMHWVCPTVYLNGTLKFYILYLIFKSFCCKHQKTQARNHMGLKNKCSANTPVLLIISGTFEISLIFQMKNVKNENSKRNVFYLTSKRANENKMTKWNVDFQKNKFMLLLAINHIWIGLFLDKRVLRLKFFISGVEKTNLMLNIERWLLQNVFESISGGACRP